MRPRIQATISQRAYDKLLTEMDTPGSPLHNRSFSRAIDTIIIEWFELQDLIRSYQERAVEDYNTIQELNGKKTDESISKKDDPSSEAVFE